MTTARRLLMGVASLLLIVANWLAFHDFLEPHTVRDWLVLVASVLVVAEFVLQLWRPNSA